MIRVLAIVVEAAIVSYALLFVLPIVVAWVYGFTDVVGSLLGSASMLFVPSVFLAAAIAASLMYLWREVCVDEDEEDEYDEEDGSSLTVLEAVANIVLLLVAMHVGGVYGPYLVAAALLGSLLGIMIVEAFA